MIVRHVVFDTEVIDNLAADVVSVVFTLSSLYLLSESLWKCELCILHSRITRSHLLKKILNIAIAIEPKQYVVNKPKTIANR